MKKFLLLTIVLLAFSFSGNAAVTGYFFYQNVYSYTPITGGTVLIDGTSAMDSWVSPAITIPSFTFGGVAYTTAYVTSNGQISLGGSAPATTTYTGISTGVGSGICICPMSADLNRATTTSSSEIRWQVVGSEIVFQWTQICRYAQTESFDMQARLNTSSGVINFVYQLNSGPGSGTTYQPQVGIRTSTTDYLNRLVSTGTEDWATSLPGTANTNTCRFTSASPQKNFISGLTYTYSPFEFLPCIAPTLQPTALTLIPGVYTIKGNFTGASGSDSYLVIRSLNSTLSANPQNGISYPVGTSLGGGVVDFLGSSTNWISSGLTPLTPYYFFVFSTNSLCSGGPLYLTSPDPLSGTQTTSSVTTYTWVATSGSASWETAGSWTPARNYPDPSDILVFDQGGNSIATNVTSETVGRITVTNSTTIHLQAAATATLTIASDGTSTDELSIASGSALLNDGASAALAITYSGVSPTGNVAGTMEMSTPTGGTTNSSFVFTGGTTPVTTVSGILANGQSGGGGIPFITGTAATLVFTSTGIYKHNFTSYSGAIPLATWSEGSTVEILGYTTATSSPTNFTQAFSNFTWNCPGQTANFAIGVTMNVSGTFTLTTTGTGVLRLTGSSSSYILNTGNFTQTGGTLDLSSSTGKGTLRCSGTFNQSAGTITETGTQVACTIEFNGATNQSITFGGTLSNTLTYQINNDVGITLTGTMAITTGASLINSSNAVTPISGGTLTYSGTTTLVYNSATGDQTATANEFKDIDGPTNLTINAPGHIVTIPFDRTIATGILLMTTGDINMGNYTLTLGSSVTSMGTLTYTAGSIIGKFKRWVSAATGSKDYPVGILGNARKAAINYTTAPTTGGTLTAQFIPTDPGNTGLPFSQGSISVNTAANAGYWRIVAGDGLTGGAYTGTFTATNFPGVTAYANLVLINRADGGGGWALNGTHVVTSGSNAAPVLSRTGMSGLDEFGVGGDAAANPMTGTNVYTVSSGEWGNGAIWSTGMVPTNVDYVTILNGHNVTLSGTKATYSCFNLTVSASGSLTNYGETLQVGGTITATGTITNNSGNITVTGGDATGITIAATTGNLNISGGTVTIGPAGGGKTRLANSGTLSVSGTAVLNINGNLHTLSGSTFNQSGGNINVDGNAGGVLANSTTAYLLNLVAPVNWTGGTLTLVDPSANTTSTYSIYYSSSTSSEVSTSHTLRFGDGVSSDVGGNANSFYTYIYASSGKLNFGNVIVNGPGTGTAAGTNRLWIPYSSATGVRGTLTINDRGEIRTSVGIYLSGNLIVNTGGTLTHTGTFYLALQQGTSGVVNPDPQQITNNGTIQNNATTPTANFYSLTINNSNTTGITLNSPLSVGTTLTLTQGIINTTATNGLLLGTATAAGTLSGATGTSYINGPFARTFAASRNATGTYSNVTLYPVGKGTSYLPVYIDPSTSSGGAVIMSGEAFTSNTGTTGAGVTTLSTSRWEALTYSGGANFTGSFIRVGDTAMVTGNQILQAPAGDGEYSPIPVATTFLIGTPNTLTTGSILPTASYTGYFAYGDVTPCTAPTAQPTAFAATYVTTTGFIGSFNAADPAASNYLVVRYPSGGTPVDPVDYTSYTVGAALGTGMVRSIGPLTTFTESGLSASTTYDYYVYSYNNAGCYGPVYYITTPLFGIVTTCGTAVDAPDTPTASQISYDRFTASWGASTSLEVHYILDVATNSTFTSFVSGYEAKNVGANLSDVVLGLTASTPYYVRVRAMVDSTSCTSPVSSTLTATTACNPTASLPIFQDFEATTFPPDCWGKFTGILDNPSYLTSTTSGWIRDDWRNITSPVDKAARINIFSTSTRYWLVTPIIDIGSTTDYQVSFDLALTDYGNSNPITADPNGTTGIDDKFAVVISTDGGLTWSSANILRLWDNESSPYVYNDIDYLGEHIELSLAGYTGNIRIGFYGESTVTNADNDLMINNFAIEVPPLCPKVRSLVTTNVTKSTADLDWTVTGLQDTWEVKYGAPGFNPETEGTLITGIHTHPYTLDPTPSLTPLTKYDWYARANCGYGGVSIWNGPKSFTTWCDYDPITSTTAGNRCGTGTVNLSATSLGGNIYWFSQFAGGSPLGAGANFTTPVISDSTFFYVATTTGEGINSSVGPVDNTMGAGGYVNLTYYEVFDVLAGSMNLDGVYVYPNTAGNVKLVILNSAGTELARVTEPVTTPQVKTFIPIGVSIAAGTGYKIGINTTTHSGSVSLYRNTAGAVYPYTVPGVISITGNTFSGYPAYYYYTYDWQISTSCTSPRIKVLAGVTPAPDFAITQDTTLCNNQVTTLAVTTGSSDFNTFTWSPENDLYSDYECLIPYVALTSTDTVYFKSTIAGPATFTCTASNTTTGCNNISTSTITNMPAYPTVTASNPNLCISGSSVMTLAPATGWGDATFQWQESSDGVYYTDIFNATSQNYTAPVITSTTYFRVLIKNSTGYVCVSPQDTVFVDYVAITETTPGERCGTGTVELEAAGSGIITWYDAETGGSVIGTGSPFTTPIISSTTTFYVGAASGTGSVNETGGKLTPASDASFITTNWGVVFTATQDFTLNSTTIYPTGSGTITIALLNSSGIELAVTEPMSVSGTGLATPNIVPLGFNVPAGVGYRLQVKAYTGITNLVRDISGAVFPYPSPSGALVVTSSWSGSVSTTTYYFFYSLNIAIGCVSAREPVIATVTPSDAITPSATPLTICPGDASNLDVTSTNLDYEYVWTPGDLSGAEQSVYPTTTTNYTVTANDPGTGCAAIASIMVTVKPAPSAVVVTPPTAPVGAIQQLVATGGTIGGDYVFGTSSTTNATSGYPAPYTNYYGGTKHQMLILASELLAAGVMPNSYINTISFNVTAVGSTFSGVLNFFQISLKNTTTSVLTSTAFEPDMVLVYGPLSQAIPTSGLPVMVSHSITPFEWDGTSNIIIQTSYSNGNNGTTTDNVQMANSNPGFVSTNYYRADNVSAGDILNAATPSGSGTARPNMVLGFSSPTTVTWSPLLGLFTDEFGLLPYTGGVTNSVYGNPAVPTTYTATSSSTNGCSTSGSMAFIGSNKTLNLTFVFPEGFYAGSNTINPSWDDMGLHFQADTADMITVELHNSGSYATVEYSKEAALTTSGTATLTTPGDKGGFYYVTVKHRNSIETTSSTAVDFSPTNITYDFELQSQAYGDNMGLMIDGAAVLYGGDSNQDGLVDGSDLSDIGNLADFAAAGYLPEDINGDGLIDGSDLSITGNNADFAIGAILP